MKATVNMIDYGKNRVCDQIINWFLGRFPNGGDVKDILATALDDRNYNSFDLWLWKYFVAEKTPFEKQAAAASKLAALSDVNKGQHPHLDAALVMIARSPAAHNYAWAIREAANAAISASIPASDVMRTLDECGIFG